MKAILTASLLSLFAVTPTLADTPSAYVKTGTQGTCIRANAVQNRIVRDNRTILFRLNDGQVWQNVLQKPCVGLYAAPGFDTETRDGWYCANRQRLRVRGQGNICYFGDFSRADWPSR